MKIGTIVTIVMAVVMASYPAKAETINMMCRDNFETEIPDTVTFAVEIDSLYYTVVVKDGVVTKIELDGEEIPEFTVRTDFKTALELVTNYSQMSWLDKVQFLVVRMQVPYDFITSMARHGVMY